MPTFKLSDKQMVEVSGWVATYIAQQRAAFHLKARPIEPVFKAAMRQFFPADILTHVQVVRGRAPEPSFYRQLLGMGIHNPPSFSQMAGVTFQDIVVHVDALEPPLLFHELVHAVQYKLLGLQEFAGRYVRGFLKGGSYVEIPLEKQAYELEAKFSADPRAPFSVEDAVKKGIHPDRL